MGTRMKWKQPKRQGLANVDAGLVRERVTTVYHANIFCPGCDKAFRSEAKYKAHYKAEHQKRTGEGAHA